MNENEIMVAPDNGQGGLMADPQTRGEFVKIGGLMVILLFTIAIIALSRPVVNRIVPAVLGLDGEVTANQPPPAEIDQPADDTPRQPDEPDTEDTGRDESETGGLDDQDEGQTDEEATIPTPTPRLHVVQPGQNLTMIAGQYDVTVEAIVQANNLTNPNRIEAGTTLIIP